jgi:hypothetical protein
MNFPSDSAQSYKDLYAQERCCISADQRLNMVE